MRKYRKNSNPTIHEVYYDVPTAAALLKIGESTLYRYINNGTVRAPKRRVLPQSELEKLNCWMYNNYDDTF